MNWKTNLRRRFLSTKTKSKYGSDGPNINRGNIGFAIHNCMYNLKAIINIDKGFFCVFSHEL